MNKRMAKRKPEHWYSYIGNSSGIPVDKQDPRHVSLEAVAIPSVTPGYIYMYVRKLAI